MTELHYHYRRFWSVFGWHSSITQLSSTYLLTWDAYTIKAHPPLGCIHKTLPSEPASWAAAMWCRLLLALSPRSCPTVCLSVFGPAIPVEVYLSDVVALTECVHLHSHRSNVSSTHLNHSTSLLTRSARKIFHMRLRRVITPLLSDFVYHFRLTFVTSHLIWPH